ncbi:hypothetical protein BDZ94DRAFT_1316601 [Collybia nuda]|uniref:Uncharacterized protein n=1 Tax=Collybia nuda TaxID=64659 RepID=A0A9P6CBJ0_9AGAR|nr:hypothetical protein BDZ94DRAFT_1316601 [Collybia nuda]
MAGQEAQNKRITLMQNEVEWLSELPLMSLTVPLLFKHTLGLNGEYQFPSDTNILQLNYGLHALQTRPHANAAFLHIENCYCEILTILQAEPQLGIKDLETTTNLVWNELEQLSHEKAFQWAQQCISTTPGPTLVNTEIHFYPQGPCNLIHRASAIVSLVMEIIFYYPSPSTACTSSWNKRYPMYQ